MRCACLTHVYRMPATHLPSSTTAGPESTDKDAPPYIDPATLDSAPVAERRTGLAELPSLGAPEDASCVYNTFRLAILTAVFVFCWYTVLACNMCAMTAGEDASCAADGTSSLASESFCREVNRHP